MKPFSDATSNKIGGLTVENGKDKVSLYGDVDLTRDKAGLAAAKNLKTILDAVVDVLKSDSALLDTVPVDKPIIQHNPFG